MAKVFNAILSLTDSDISIPVFERERRIVKKHYRFGKKKDKIALKTSFWELSVATSLAYLSKKNSGTNILEAISVMLRLVNSFEVTNGILSISPNFHQLKDFAKTSRIGEIGQGLSYLLAQELWDCKIFYDLDDFLSNKQIDKTDYNGNIKILDHDGRIADFICFKNQGSLDAIVIESKAGANLDDKKEKTKISSAIPQINPFLGRLLDTNGNEHANIQNSYAVCSSIDDDPKKSFISYVDPESKDTMNGDIDEIIRNQYAKFFILSGLKEYAENLLNNRKIEINTENVGKESKYNGYSEISDNGFFKTFISNNALNFLTGKSKSISTEKLKEKESHVASFNDGTIYELNVSLLESVAESLLFKDILENF